MDARYPTGAPDLINPVAGVRIWRVAPNLWWQMGGLLWSPAMKEPWATGEVYHATCSSDHAAGSPGCTCGVYSFYTPALAMAGGYWPEPTAGYYNRLVAGVIAGWGEVDLADHGMRCTNAQIVAIFSAGVTDADLPLSREEIADGYHAEVIHQEHYDAFCKERGLKVFSPHDLDEGS